MIPEVYTPLRFKDIGKSIDGFFKKDNVKKFVKILETKLNDTVFLFSSGTAALTVCLTAARQLSDSRGVVISAYTCPEVLYAVQQAGCKPILCDVARESFSFNIPHLTGILKEKSILAVVPNHLFGIYHSLNEVNQLLKGTNVFLIQDSAQAFPLDSRQLSILKAGDAGFISLGRGKTATTLGGGILVSRNKELTKVIDNLYGNIPGCSIPEQIIVWIQMYIYKVVLRPLVWKFLNPLVNRESRQNHKIRKLSPIQGSLGLRLLPCLENIVKERSGIAAKILERVSGKERFHLPAECRGGVHSFLRLPVFMANEEARDNAYGFLRNAGIGVSKMYKKPLDDPKCNNEDYANALDVSKRLLTIPLNKFVSEKHIDIIANALIL